MIQKVLCVIFALSFFQVTGSHAADSSSLQATHRKMRIITTCTLGLTAGMTAATIAATVATNGGSLDGRCYFIGTMGALLCASTWGMRMVGDFAMKLTAPENPETKDRDDP